MLTKLFAIVNGRVEAEAQAQDAEDFALFKPTKTELKSLFGDLRRMLPLLRRYFVSFEDVAAKLGTMREDEE